MIRRHYFLFAALAAIVAMLAIVAVKLVADRAGGGGQGGAQVAGGPGGGGGGGPGGGGRRGPGGGPGGRGQGGGGVDVTTVQVNLRPFADRIEVLGVAKGRQSVSITSKNSELITAVRFRDGDHVRAGQVLVDLQGTEQDAAIDQAQSQVDIAKLNADRWITLESKGIASKAQADQYRASLAQARASLAAAKSRRSDRVIRAPFAGVVGLSDVAPGALISPGAVIATLDDIDVIRVDFDVPDRYLPVIRDGTPIVASADSYPNERFAGTIAKLDSRVNERTRTIKARALLNNSGGRLKPGMLMRIGIQESLRQALVAPESAVQFDDTQSYVFVVTPGEGGRTMSNKRPVVVGSRDRGFIEIKAGVKPGDVIVADGINRLQPTMPVRVVEGPGAVAGGPGRGPRGAGGFQGGGQPAAFKGGPGGAAFKGGGEGGRRRGQEVQG